MQMNQDTWRLVLFSFGQVFLSIPGSADVLWREKSSNINSLSVDGQQVKMQLHLFLHVTIQPQGSQVACGLFLHLGSKP